MLISVLLSLYRVPLSLWMWRELTQFLKIIVHHFKMRKKHNGKKNPVYKTLSTGRSLVTALISVNIKCLA